MGQNKHEITWLWGDRDWDLKVLRMFLESVKKAPGKGSESYEKSQEMVEKVLKKLWDSLRKCWKSVKSFI